MRKKTIDLACTNPGGWDYEVIQWSLPFLVAETQLPLAETNGFLWSKGHSLRPPLPFHKNIPSPTYAAFNTSFSALKNHPAIAFDDLPP